jgi:phage shock protein A
MKKIILLEEQPIVSEQDVETMITNIQEVSQKISTLDLEKISVEAYNKVNEMIEQINSMLG